MYKHPIKFDWLEGSYVYADLYEDGVKQAPCKITCVGVNDYLMDLYMGDSITPVRSTYWDGIERQVGNLKGSCVGVNWNEGCGVKGKLVGHEPTLTLYRECERTHPTYVIKNEGSSLITEGRCPLEALVLFTHEVIRNGLKHRDMFYINPSIIPSYR